MEHHLRSDEKELGHYQLRRLLGEGGFGQVYEAWDSKLQRSIAIKRLKPQMSSRPENLLDEARMAASLRHPAFVKIFSIDGDAEQQSIIMEYVDGSTLRQLSQGQAQPEDKVLDLVCQVAEAMEEAHASKLIHGDIKPSNLMVEATGTVRIMDFGLSRKIDPDATESVVIDETHGTIAYLAPELLLGASPNEQSDVYALGVVMYEMLTGERPFAHLSGLSLAAAHIQSSSDIWTFPPQVSSHCVSLVRAMTARDLTRRLPSMHSVREAAHSRRASGPVIGRRQQSSASRVSAGAVKHMLISRSARIAGCIALALALGVGGAYVGGTADWFRRHTPFFSEAAAMRTGLEALKTFDRDESLDTAIRSFQTILDRNPNHAAAAAGLSLAFCLRHAGDKRDETWLQRADASAQLAMKLNDQLAMAYVALGTVRVWQGSLDEATKLVDGALRLDPRNAFALMLEADILMKARRIPEAQGKLNAAIALYPRDRVLQDTLGTLHFQRGDYQAAESAFRRSIEIEPDAVAAYANLSYALVRQDRVNEALEVLQHGLQIRPTGRLYTNLGSALFNRGEYVAAAQAFERAVSSAKGSNNNYLRWANLADTLRWIPGRGDESRKAYQEAVALLMPLLERSPSDPMLLSRLGLYSARLGDRTAALAHTARALALDPENPDVHFRAAMTYEINGARDKALAAIKNAQDRGYSAKQISVEPDLIALRRDPNFHQSTNGSAK